MKSFLAFLLFIPFIAQAKFIASGGPEFTSSFESDINSSSGEPSLKSFPLPGLRGEIEYGHADYKRITIFGSISYSQGPGRTHYDYTDPDDLNNTRISDVQTKVSLTRLSTGIRIKLIEQKMYHFFAGGGLQFGVLNLNLDRSHFKGKATPSADFEQNENQGFRGYFGELGGELKFNTDFGIRLAAQMSAAKTNSFEILGDREVDFKSATVAFSYVWYIN